MTIVQRPNLKEKCLIVNNLWRRYQRFSYSIFIKNNPYKYLFTILYKITSYTGAKAWYKYKYLISTYWLNICILFALEIFILYKDKKCDGVLSGCQNIGINSYMILFIIKK